MTPAKPFSTAARAAYDELKAALHAESNGWLRGAPTRVQRGGKVYWYDSYRVGSDVRKTYLGEDGDELRARIWREKAARQDAELRKPDRSRLVKRLKAEGLAGPDAGAGSLLAALAGADAFRHGVAVIGSAAFRLYEGELGIRLGGPADWTGGPSRLTLALPREPDDALTAALADFAFDPSPSLRRERSWRWRQSRGDTLVGFATTATEAAERARYVKPLGVYAEPVLALDHLLSEPITAAVPYRSGVLVSLPAPERFSIHALLAAERRKGPYAAAEAARDRDQAELLARALASTRPGALRRAWEEAMARTDIATRLEAAVVAAPAFASLLRGSV